MSDKKQPYRILPTVSNVPIITLDPEDPSYRTSQALSEGFKKPAFKENNTYVSQYKEMEGRSTTLPKALLRRYLNGELDYKGAVYSILQALDNYNNNLTPTPTEFALLSIVFPEFEEFYMEEYQKEMLTELSEYEKSILRKMVDAVLKQMSNYGAGYGGDRSIPFLKLT